MDLLFANAVKLYVPPLIDLSRHPSDRAYLTVNYTAVALASDAVITGIQQNGITVTDPCTIKSMMTSNLAAVALDTSVPILTPLVNTSFYVQSEDNSKKTQDGSTFYAYPFFRLKRGLPAQLQVTNKTGFSYDLHWHGLNTTGEMDGASQEVEFGNQTAIGPTWNIDLPAITNNSCMQWVHAHPMFYTSMLATMGTFGLVDIIDDISAPVNQDIFTYGDNYVMLYYSDVDVNADGSLDYRNTYIDGWRANYGLINAHLALSWSNQTKYHQPMTHKTTKSLVKIALLNATGSFRNIYVGVSDRNGIIRPFYLIQTDTGLRNPCAVMVASLAPGNRFAILIDLADYHREEAYLFFYNMDLTLTKNVSYDSTGGLICTTTQTGTTVTPTPIPNTCGGNANSAIMFPPQPSNEDPTSIVIPGSVLPLPSLTTIQRHYVLKIRKSRRRCHHKDKNTTPSLQHLIKHIRRIVFGDSYTMISAFPRHQLDAYDFELKAPFDYLSLLNPRYFFNLPNIQIAPRRNFVLYAATYENYFDPQNPLVPYGSTDYVEGANRHLVDMWNSSELDTIHAQRQYQLTPNAYKPTVLPSCLFQIAPADPCAVNLDMLSNDTLYIDIFDMSTNPLPPRTYDASGNWIPDYTNYPYFADPANPNIAYSNPSVNTTAFNGPTSPWPAPIAATVKIVYPKTDRPLNIQEWTDLVNLFYRQTMVTLDGVTAPLSTYLTFDWTYYPYQVPFGTDASGTTFRTPILLHTVMVKHTNASSRYYFRMTGKWELLQFMGKSVGAMRMVPPGIMPTMDMSGSMMMNYPGSPMHCMCACGGPCLCGDGCECDKTSININNMIQMVYTVYADPLQPYLTASSDEVPLMVNMTDIVTFGIPPRDWTDTVLNRTNSATWVGDNNGTYKGFIDGYANDNLMNFSVPLDSSEKWVYYNMDTADSHPFHFHLTTGYCAPNDPLNTPSVMEQSHTLYPYSRDTYAIGSQSQMAWYVKFSNYRSSNGQRFRHLGFMYHCHYLAHHDMMMMGQYYVY